MTDHNSISDMFGSMVFGDDAMKARLPEHIYRVFKDSIRNGRGLDRAAANAMADAMKDWAIEKGATHYTHWFQPMTGITAEKHDSFIAPHGEHIILEFSGKELIKGESDASSLPSGGLRATFEARGYTSWDPTSYAFIKDKTLCIPTAFCSYTGLALDNKTPLLRSMEALRHQAERALGILGMPGTKVNIAVGPEQEYFLIDCRAFSRRPDLIFTGRTLFGARPPKGQEMDDHYFGALKPRVSAFMRELDEELWKLGVMAKTEHNETAPSQHELAVIYTTVNIAIDHNQLIMETMRKVAARHDMVCLLHEKPFAGVNGSGKHNNWSLITETGQNLLEPGENPTENAQFLLFFCAVMKAVDMHQDILRLSCAGAGNDLRLGGSEAPPAIISMFIGEDLLDILRAAESGKTFSQKARTSMNTGVDILPTFRRDATDRNRTSPFAFTGNKFEFRMPGSSLSVAGPNIALNAIVADVLSEFNDELKRADDLAYALNAIIRRAITGHKRIIFNGNNYSGEWISEARARGLLNISSTPAALAKYTDEKNIMLFARHGVLSEQEIISRQEIMLENYCKGVRIEALTMSDMLGKDILPAIIKYSGELAQAALIKSRIGIKNSTESALSQRLSDLSFDILTGYENLNAIIENIPEDGIMLKKAEYYHDTVLTAMDALRRSVDHAELLVDSKIWPYPTYGELLYGVR
jgi:glutamine synthetase